MSKKYSSEEMIVTIKHYDSYFGCKRTKRSLYIMSTSINGFVMNNDLESPNQYLLYLIADKNLQSIKNKKEWDMIMELGRKMDNDLFVFQPYPIHDCWCGNQKTCDCISDPHDNDEFDDTEGLQKRTDPERWESLDDMDGSWTEDDLEKYFTKHN